MATNEAIVCRNCVTQVGEGEKLVRALFAVAREMQPSVIFVGKSSRFVTLILVVMRNIAQMKLSCMLSTYTSHLRVAFFKLCLPQPKFRYRNLFGFVCLHAFNSRQCSTCTQAEARGVVNHHWRSPIRVVTVLDAA